MTNTLSFTFLRQAFAKDQVSFAIPELQRLTHTFQFSTVSVRFYRNYTIE